MFYQQVRTSFFNIMFELLKEKQTGLFFGCIMVLIAFVQLIGLIFEQDKYGWEDQFFLKFVINLCAYSRVIEAINNAGSVFFYWAFMLFAVIYLITMIGLLIFMNHFLTHRKLYMEQVVKLLRIMIILMSWIFYLPFFEIFLSIMKCNSDGTHYLDSSMVCFQGLHIFFFVVCIIFLVILFAISIVVAMLFNETQPVQEDVLSRMESSFEVALVVYRSVVGAFAGFCNGETCSWVLITVYILASGFLCFQYYKTVPYYNSFISVFCGSTIFTYFWIAINAILMKFLDVSGHIVIIIVGIPLIVFLVKSLREFRIEILMKTSIDRLNSDIDALLQVNKITDYSRGVHRDSQERMTMIGVINLHITECLNMECPCKEQYELFDIKQNDFSMRNYNSMHQDDVFLSHFIKKLYDDALNKFINSPGIHIGFSFYLFKVMKNIHAALLELNIAQKKKPSLQQQFTIFRYKNIIEDHIKQDHLDHKEVYPQLTNVIEFERLFGEMQKSIELVSNLQVEFWTHLTTLVPDLNVLNELGKKIYVAAEEVDNLWTLLCIINPNYQHALTLYGEYMKDIRNHEHIGTALIERGFNNLTNKKTLDEHAASSDVLFSDDTTVVHVSGNKESIGKIMNASQGLSKVFGYSKNEVVGHSVNILMPAVFAKRHTEFMERFFRTGRQVIFYQERQLFASHRNGNCFHMKILVKQFPNLVDGIQYVGMIKPILSDFEYIITDMDGVIDSFTKGIISLLGLTPNIFKDKDSQINIMLLAPDLIQFFQDSAQKGKVAKSKYREAGGEPLTLIVPQDFNLIAKSEARSGGGGRAGKGGRGHRSGHNANRNRSLVFRQFLKALQKNNKRGTSSGGASAFLKDKMPTATELLKQIEYVKCERKRDVQCEIIFLEFKANSQDSTKMLIFKVSKQLAEREQKGYGFEGDLQAAGLNKKGNLRNKRGAALETNSAMVSNRDGNQNDMQSLEEDQDLENGVSEGVKTQRTGSNKNLVKEEQFQFKRGNTVESQKKINFQEQYDQIITPQGQPGLQKKPTQTMIGSGPMKIPYSQNPGQQLSGAKENIVARQRHGTNHPSGDSRVAAHQTESQASAGGKKSKSLDQFNANSEEEDQDQEDAGSQEENQQDSQRDRARGSQSSAGMASPKFMHQSVRKDDGQVDVQKPVNIIDEAPNEDDIETPRVEITAMKLDMPQQKEKVSFFEELKKQSFIMSENSTNKVDGTGKLNVTDVQKQEKASFQKEIGGNGSSGAQISSSARPKGILPENMVKVFQNRNNLMNFAGDDEPQDIVGGPYREDTQSDGEQQSLLQKGGQQTGTRKTETDKANQENNKTEQDDQEEEDQNGDEEEEAEDEEEEQEEDDEGQGDGSEEQDKMMDAYPSSKGKQSEGPGSQKEGSAKASSGRNAESSVASKKLQEPHIQIGRQGTNSKTAFKAIPGGLQVPDVNTPGSDRMHIQDGEQHEASSNKSKSKTGYGAEQPYFGGGASSGSKRQNRSSQGSLSEGKEDYNENNTVKKRDTHKIRTNPKYRCVDDGSDDEADEVKHEEYQQLSSKEIDFRETIIKQEKKRLKKERKMKEKELKKLKNRESGSSAASHNSEDGVDGETGLSKHGDDDEDEKSSSSSDSSVSSSEESKGGAGGHGRTPPGQKKLSRKSSLRENDDGDVSSVSTRRSKTERNHYILRMAIDEKYVPRSIQNLRYAAYIIFVILGLLSIVYYVIQNSLFDKINQNIKNIHNSEERLSYIIDITLRTRTLTLVNQNYLILPNATARDQLLNTTISELRSSARRLKEAQTDLSLKTAFLSDSQLQKINPKNVDLQYKKYPEMPDYYRLSMWEAIMEIIVSAFRISTLELKQVLDDQASVLFVMKNCLNSVMQALKSSTDAIINESENSRQSNMSIFLYLLIAASCSLFISLVFLIPVINKVKRNKQEVLELFTHKQIDKHIDDQLKVCRNFVSLRLQQSNDAAAEGHEIDEVAGGAGQGGQPGQGTQNGGDKELQNELNGANSKFLRRNKKKSKGKKWKKLSNDFGSILLKFILFIAVIEGYFLTNFLLSKQFLEEVQQLTQELKLLISRQPVQSFLLLIQKELIYSNGTALIEGNRSETYVPNYHESIYDEEEGLLDKFSQNYDFHSSEYNDLFNNIIYSNVCQYVTYDSKQACEEFNQGILKKGVYSSVIKYWDFLRQLNHDFSESPRNNATIIQFLNDPRLQIAEKMEDYYFKIALGKLVEQLEQDINTFFDTEYVQNRTIFIVYIFYIILLYFLIWRKFVQQLQIELWKTKSMLGILPIKVCSDIEEIRYFIISNSSNDFMATKA